jgi:multidrug resistance efflux pump
MKTRLIKLAMALAVLMVIFSMTACGKAASSTQPPAAQSSAQPANPTGSRPAGPTGSGAPTAKPGGAAPQTSASPTPSISGIKGSGTVTVDTYSNLYFGTAGQIAKINVKIGDRVKKGTALAKLDTTTLEAALAQARVNLDQAKLGQTQAASTLATAQFNLDKTQVVSQVKDAITNAQWTIKAAQVNLDQARASNDATAANNLTTYIGNAQRELGNQQKKLNLLLGQAEYAGVVTYDIMGQTYDRLTVEDARMKQLAVDSAQLTLDKSQDSINQAQKNIDVAQLQLNQATIIAPFDGLVATVNGNEGDVLAAPSQSQKPVIYLIDPATMEVNIYVNELDMPKVKIGQKAAVSIDAYPGVKLDGKVTVISPSPTVQGGIVDYQVTVAFTVPSNMDAKIGMSASAAVLTN